MIWFDSHLDLASLAVAGRDMCVPLDASARPHPPAAVTLPELRQAGVQFALATIFTVSDSNPPASAGPPYADRCHYHASDPDDAFRAGRAQLEAYLTWRDAGHISLDLRSLFHADPHVGQTRAGMGVGHVVPLTPEQVIAQRGMSDATQDCTASIWGGHVGILMENADPIRSPAELSWWKKHGLVAVGLTWATSSRYATGNADESSLGPSGKGLLPPAMDLIAEMDRLNIVHDLSHLSQRAVDELLATTDRLVFASHANCRALFPKQSALINQRHLTDETIRQIDVRGGVVGINLVANFLRENCPANETASMDDLFRHIDHVCSIVGHTRAVGLGSDIDGGFSANSLPESIDRASDISRIADMLSDHGWSDDQVTDFAWRNWARMWLRVSKQGRGVQSAVSAADS